MHSVAPLVRCLFLHIVRYASDVCLIFLIFQFSICGFQGTVCSVSVLSLLKTSGDGEIRTLDPLLARQVLSQLSYTPTDAGHPLSRRSHMFCFFVVTVFYFFQPVSAPNDSFSHSLIRCPYAFRQVGLSGLEPPTSRLSGVRSNRLSYKPFLNLASTCSPMPSPA